MILRKELFLPNGDKYFKEKKSVKKMKKARRARASKI